MLREINRKLVDGQDLTREQARTCIREIMTGNAGDISMASFLTAMHMKGETPEEIAGGVEAMTGLALAFPATGTGALDTCGTGGDGKETFNVSTASAFVAAAAGVPVIKHGNRSASGRTGSADVLEALGMNIGCTPSEGAALLEETNLVFLYAPAYHQAMKHAAPVRKELGFRTIFNVLGPLSNPAGVDHQLLGVYSPELLPVMAKAMHSLGRIRAMVVHGLEGLDEISISGPTAACEVTPEGLREFMVHPGELGLDTYPLEAVTGGDPQDNARLIEELFAGKRTGAALDFLLINGGAAIYVGGQAASLKEGVVLARDLIREGRVLALLETYRKRSQKGQERCS